MYRWIYICIDECICIYKCMYRSMCMFLYIYIYIYVSKYVYVYINICIEACICFYIYIYIYVLVNVCMYIYICRYVYIYIYWYIYIYNTCICISNTFFWGTSKVYINMSLDLMNYLLSISLIEPFKYLCRSYTQFTVWPAIGGYVVFKYVYKNFWTFHCGNSVHWLK